METAIRWSPSSTPSEQRFLIADVSGRAFTHCRIDKYDGERLKYSTISTQNKVPAFRAFDWSPHDENVVAVGQWSGDATVLRIDDQSESISLTIKHQRLCNAVTFNKNGLLATGLERVRNDFCLNIWDISQRPLIRSPSASTSGTGRQLLDPVRKFASSEAITSIKFFPDHPDVLVCGVKGTSIRVYDLRESMGTPSLQFNTFCVHNIAIDPLDENYFASAGPLKDTTIQIFDRRSSPSPTAATIGSGSVFNSQSGPIQEFKKVFDSSGSSLPPSIWSVRYCRGRSGFLGALASNGSFKVFEMKKEYQPMETLSNGTYEGSSHDPTLDGQQVFTKRIYHVGHPYDDKKRGRSENHRVVTFDFANLAGPTSRPCAITLRGNHAVEIYELEGSVPVFGISPRATFAVRSHKFIPDLKTSPPLHATAFLQIISPFEDTNLARSMKEIRAKMSNSCSPDDQVQDEMINLHLQERSHLSNFEAHADVFDYQNSKITFRMEDALTFFTVARRRCAEGYLFDYDKNIQIVSDDMRLQDLWAWINRARHNAEDGVMIAKGADLSYLGVYGIWNNDLGPQRTREMENNVHTDIACAVAAICDRIELTMISPIESSYSKHRQLCLYTCGLGLNAQTLEDNVKGLVDQGQNTKAAALAIIHNQPKLAFLALRNGSASQAHRELSLALAGFVKGGADKIWGETVLEVAKELSDPYARAILALVSHGDWRDVLAVTSLPLHHRVGVALMYLPDDELTSYIASTTAESIAQGDIEGIALTGLTEKSISLFQTYILKSFDLQTAVLALAHTSPRYISSSLVDTWRESYRAELNSYRLFLQRVQFDIQATKLSTPVRTDRQPFLIPPPRQVSIRCNNCDQALDHRNSSSTAKPVLSPRTPGSNSPTASAAPAIHPSPSFGTHPGSIFGDARSGTICPKCSRHMPRCVICMLWLGMPDPSSKGVAAADAAAQAKQTTKNPLDSFASVCQACWHMSHVEHAREWFADHDVCAVPACNCRCAKLDR